MGTSEQTRSEFTMFMNFNDYHMRMQIWKKKRRGILLNKFREINISDFACMPFTYA